MTEGEQNNLIINNTGLVPKIAADFRGRAPIDELIGEGHLGLVRAARNFKGSKGNFSSWASICINTAMTNFLRNWERLKPLPEEVPDISGDLHNFNLIEPAPEETIIDKIYEFDAWGDAGNARAIQILWSRIGASPEDLYLSFEELSDKKEKIGGAFLSLSKLQRSLILGAYLTDPPMKITDLARAQRPKISYKVATLQIKKALSIMKKVIERMEEGITARQSALRRAARTGPWTDRPRKVKRQKSTA